MDNNSSYTKKEGQGSLFKNDKKTAPNQPDYTGSIMVGGVEKRIAAWTRTARNGSTYLSISLSDFQEGYGHGGGYSGSSYGSTPQAPAPAPAPSIDDMPADFGSDAPLEDLPF